MRREALTRTNVGLVAGFDCGDVSYAVEVADWIKGVGDQVWMAMESGVRVWLYLTEQQELIGFGSLGVQEVRLDETDQILGELLVLPYFGLHKAFHKKPDGPYQQFYSRQILRDLIAEARQHPSGLRRLALYVNPENKGAIRLYADEEFGFISVGTFDGDHCMVKEL